MKLKQFEHWAQKEYSPKQRLTLVIPALIFFCLFLPVLFLSVSITADRSCELPLFHWGYWNGLIGAVCTTAGAGLGLWTVWVQFVLGRGTPSPFMPTQSLIIAGPYRFCRNPMILGVFTAYVGLAIWASSPSGIIMCLIFILVASAYIKLIEEKELEVRFGSTYTDYKQFTSFIFPVFRKNK
ncbi:isoprenylcysteine carboxylmethyltransferase family protein [bacterium]|nr:isoprenylcysteine carboxylmethyltransferase family protein [bacterium]